ncbi:hypothetical protein ACFWUW_08390 [Streptomyces sp. NPDC058655]|uniref:hypothetical protein n=1 Tax=Streptomyces sp. NPDC058655 TaxID=3346577 RepID=UPI0036624CF8
MIQGFRPGRRPAHRPTLRLTPRRPARRPTPGPARAEGAAQAEGAARAGPNGRAAPAGRAGRLLARRAPGAAALAAAVLAAAAFVSGAAPALALANPAHSRPAGGPDPGHGELAGTAAGAGRERPGRPVGDRVNREAMVATRPLPVRPPNRPSPPPPPSPPPRPRPEPTAVATGPVTALGTGPNERAADLAAHLLPLGTGFALMGVGLGYLGVRLRRSI